MNVTALQLSSVPEQRCFRQDIDDEFDIAQSAILDTGSTFSAMANKKLAAGVHSSDDMMQMNANAGLRAINQKGQVPCRNEESIVV